MPSMLSKKLSEKIGKVEMAHRYDNFCIFSRRLCGDDKGNQKLALTTSLEAEAEADILADAHMFERKGLTEREYKHSRSCTAVRSLKLGDLVGHSNSLLFPLTSPTILQNRNKCYHLRHVAASIFGLDTVSMKAAAAHFVYGCGCAKRLGRATAITLRNWPTMAVMSTKRSASQRYCLEPDQYRVVTKDEPGGVAMYAAVLSSRWWKAQGNDIQYAYGKVLEFGVIVYATGIGAVDGAYQNIDITGRNGLKLNDAWKDGANALYGPSVANFPNLFIISGPKGPFANIVPFLEGQGSDHRCRPSKKTDRRTSKG
ncbi:uncharacterized protein BDV17DRAFT_291078 [Aspergillus undulatus]|uniref:uncharacterized protein n=1 Tax=Aspergillus undulatus TaxID=1810928 RepID=UPI003CCDBA4C